MKSFKVVYMICNRKYTVFLKGNDKKEIARFFSMYMLGSLMSIEEVIK